MIKRFGCEIFLTVMLVLALGSSGQAHLLYDLHRDELAHQERARQFSSVTQNFLEEAARGKAKKAPASPPSLNDLWREVKLAQPKPTSMHEPWQQSILVQKPSQLTQQPNIKLFARDIDLKLDRGKHHHAYTIFTYSSGKEVIVTGFPEGNNPLTGNLQGAVVKYTKENKEQELFPKSDWMDNSRRVTIKEWKFGSDAELEQALQKARKAIDFVETGNKGGRFDYDVCVSNKCWGANSNTVQKIVYKEMGLHFQIPKDVNLPGIEGEFYDGPLDNLPGKLAEEHQKQKP